MDNAAVAAAVSFAATAAAGGVGEAVDEFMTTGEGGDAPSAAQVDACAA